MPTPHRGQIGTGEKPAVAPHWHDRKRYVWLLGLVIPTLVPMSWAAVAVTGWSIFWWSGPMLTFVLLPALDFLVGSDSENPPDSALNRLE